MTGHRVVQNALARRDDCPREKPIGSQCRSMQFSPVSRPGPPWGDGVVVYILSKVLIVAIIPGPLGI
jgi:hypothetical protein